MAVKARLSGLGKNLLSHLCAWIVAIAFFEGALRLFSLDSYFLAQALFYQDHNLELYQLSADPFLRFEPRPGAATDNPRTTINSHGARGREHPLEKGDGVFRILMGGGSTTFGYEVADDETIPARLEQILNEQAGSRGEAKRTFEVWNLGVEAYTLSQVAHLLQSKLGSLEPDLLLVQLYNQGRRSFLLDAASPSSRIEKLLADREAMLENFLAWKMSTPPRSDAWFERSAIARVAVAIARRRYPEIRQSAWADARSIEKQHDLEAAAAARNVPVVYVGIPAARDAFSYYDENLGVPPRRFIKINEEGREPEYYDCHPPPRLLFELATTIAAELAGRGYIPHTKK